MWDWRTGAHLASDVKISPGSETWHSQRVLARCCRNSGVTSKKSHTLQSIVVWKEYLLSVKMWIISQWSCKLSLPAPVLDHLHPSLRVIYVSFRTACPPQSLHGMTADFGVRGGAPGTLRAGLDALITLRVWCETLLFFGLAGNQQNQQQAETVQSHSHPAFRVKLWEDEHGWNDEATLLQLCLISLNLQ